MNLKNWGLPTLFLSLLAGTLYGLLLPMYSQVQKDKVNQAVIETYQARISQKENQLLNKKDVTKGAIPHAFTISSTKEGVMGSIELPTVGLAETPIYKKETAHSFFHYKYGSFPSSSEGGNLTLEAGKRWRDQMSLLKLVQLKTGECFFVKVHGQTLTYQVIDRKKIDALENKILPNEQDLTLVLSDFTGFTDYRFAFIAKQIPGASVNRNMLKQKQTLNYQTLISVFLLVNGLFFCWLILSYQRYAHRLSSKPFRTRYGGYRKLRTLLKITRGYYILLYLIMSCYLGVMVYRYIFLR
ncbi:hypothetical protein [Enterococcus raffinosus]|uniref:hypothetical protein n=1 Tax=Enterococcus raffinosus TaxID=71452 RepID=UPI00288F5F6C|nr:hypothetical protein [Enterococcus raffinosus]MDT2521733.1 hypothetical protein [Enterococcus raffinosus]